MLDIRSTVQHFASSQRLRRGLYAAPKSLCRAPPLCRERIVGHAYKAQIRNEKWASQRKSGKVDPRSQGRLSFLIRRFGSKPLISLEFGRSQLGPQGGQAVL